MWCGMVWYGVAWFPISCIFFSTIDCSIHAATSNTSAVLCTLYAVPSFPILFNHNICTPHQHYTMQKVPPIVPRKKPSLKAKKLPGLPTPSPSPSPSPSPLPAPSPTVSTTSSSSQTVTDDTIILPKLRARPETQPEHKSKPKREQKPTQIQAQPLQQTPVRAKITASAAPIALKLEDIMAHRQRTDIHINGHLRTTKTALEKQYEQYENESQFRNPTTKRPPQIPPKPKPLHASSSTNKQRVPPPPVKPKSLSLRKVTTGPTGSTGSTPLREATMEMTFLRTVPRRSTAPVTTSTPFASSPSPSPPPLAHPTKQRSRGPRRRLPTALTV
jgi:hypothetical protein